MNSNKAKDRVLFLGEGSLEGPARYLAGILSASGIPFDHVADEQPIPPRFLERIYAVIICSDYRHASFTSKTEAWVVDRVLSGTGLLMIGGWASFTGLVGGYAGTQIERLLPVSCDYRDDRVNRAMGALMVPPKAKKGGLSATWKNPPVVCGYHRVRVKKNGKTLLELRDLHFAKGGLRLGASYPLWVVGQAGKGHTGAFMTDCAPHWAGGLIDWGRRRVKVRIQRTQTIEVGETYLAFFKAIIEGLYPGASERRRFLDGFGENE